MKSVLRFPLTEHSWSTLEVPDGARLVFFQYQDARGRFSAWFESSVGAVQKERREFRVVPTGLSYDGEHRASLIMRDGFHVFHLVERTMAAATP